MFIWRLFAELDLSDSREQQFPSLHACFIRQLRDSARPINQDPALLISPCDAIVGASGSVESGQALQIKGFPYSLRDLLGDDAHGQVYRDGSYVTLRLTSSMYHRFHAPHDCAVEAVSYMSGDTWNVNPIALKRVERLFCKNERAAISVRLARTGHAVTLVPVAAILVASIRLNFHAPAMGLRCGGPRTARLHVPLAKGQEMGWFEHGSTVIVFAPLGFTLAQNVRERCMIRVGEPLMRLPD